MDIYTVIVGSSCQNVRLSLFHHEETNQKTETESKRYRSWQITLARQSPSRLRWCSSRSKNSTCTSKVKSKRILCAAKWHARQFLVTPKWNSHAKCITVTKINPKFNLRSLLAHFASWDFAVDVPHFFAFTSHSWLNFHVNSFFNPACTIFPCQFCTRNCNDRSNCSASICSNSSSHMPDQPVHTKWAPQALQQFIFCQKTVKPSAAQKLPLKWVTWMQQLVSLQNFAKYHFWFGCFVTSSKSQMRKIWIASSSFPFATWHAKNFNLLTELWCSTFGTQITIELLALQLSCECSLGVT